jgi:hypothetical protein
MSRFFLITCVVLCLICVSSSHGETMVVKSLAELRKQGISVERLRHDTPMASAEIGSLVEPEKASGEYDFTECIVLSALVAPDSLALADAGTLDSVTVARRSDSSKERAIFLVLGKDLQRSYLAFQFNAKKDGATKTMRYLFSVSRVPAAME